jgi:hypothetical protein
MTDLTTLVLPAWAIPSRPRRAAIDEHAIHVREQWWRDAISARGLPGTPPAGTTLTRADVWALTDEVFTLLWRTLAWGSGRYLRQNARRLDSIAADVPRAENLLARAVEESRRDPAGAYAMLRPGRRNEIRRWARLSSRNSCTSPAAARHPSRNGRPRRPTEDGNSGATRAHWASVRTAARGTDQASPTPPPSFRRHAPRSSRPRHGEACGGIVGARCRVGRTGLGGGRRNPMRCRPVGTHPP